MVILVETNLNASLVVAMARAENKRIVENALIALREKLHAVKN